MRPAALILAALAVGSHAAAFQPRPAAPASVPAPTPTPTPAKPAEAAAAVAIEVNALDSAHAGAGFQSAFRGAVNRKPPAILLIVQPDAPSRADTLREALLAVKACGIPVVVYTPRTRGEAAPRTAFAAVALGLLADHWADGLDTPRSAKVIVASETAARDLVEAKTPWDSYEADLRELLAPRLATLRWSTHAAEVLCWPRATWWGVSTADGKHWTLASGGKPDAASGERVELLAESVAGPERSFDVPLAAMIGEGSGPQRASSWAQFCKDLKLKPAASVDATVGVPLEDIRREVLKQETETRRVQLALDDAFDALNKGKSAQRRLEPAQVEIFEKMLRSAESALADAESALEAYPEILRTVPPGKSALGAKASAQPARWRSLVESHHKQIEALRERFGKIKAR